MPSDEELSKYRNSTDPVVRRAELLHGSPYELAYVSKPTPATTKYVFQHTVAITPAEASSVVLEAMGVLREGRAEWTSGERWPTPPELLEKLRAAL